MVDKVLNTSSTASPTRPYTHRKNSSSLEDEHNSQEDCDSAYSCARPLILFDESKNNIFLNCFHSADYNNPDYFPNTSSHTPSLPVFPSPTTRLRARTESILPVDSFTPSGYPQVRRRYCERASVDADFLLSAVDTIPYLHPDSVRNIWSCDGETIPSWNLVHISDD